MPTSSSSAHPHRLLLAAACVLLVAGCSSEVAPRQADRETTPGLVVVPLDSPGTVAYVARGTVSEEFFFNADVGVEDREGVAAPISGTLIGPLPQRGTVVVAGDVLFVMAPTLEMQAAAAELEAALLALEMGNGDQADLEARVAAASQVAEELGLPTDEQALQPLPKEFVTEAPTSGTVLETHPPIEGIAAQGDVLIELGDTEDLVVNVSVPPDIAELVEVGSPVLVATRDGRGEPVNGVVASIQEPEEGAEADAEVTITVELETDAFEYGTRVRVAITGVSHEDVLWLPPEVIRSHDGQTFVIVEDEDDQKRVNVLLGAQTEEQVEVRGLLYEGDKVIGP
ncbi:MAG TPA: efflux RND transporter periplasmic adaptor subunit [Acidimicrobiia bacterium]